MRYRNEVYAFWMPSKLYQTIKGAAMLGRSPAVGHCDRHCPRIVVYKRSIRGIVIAIFEDA